MINWTYLGKYLGRTVRATQLNNISDSSIKDLSSSLVLVYLSSLPEKDDVRTYIRRFVKAEPLALVFAGACADKAFDQALNILQTHQKKRHIMTKLCDDKELGEIFEDFFFSTWPDEERFDEWEDYAVFVLQCNHSSYIRLLAELKNFCD